MRNLFEALRPSQWIKNLSLFAAAILNGQILNPAILLKTIIAFIVFCCLSSSSYLINDLVDITKDRLHPSKKDRPLARGDISKTQAFSLAIILLVLGLFLSILINNSFFGICFFFIVFQYSYSLFLKKKAIIDIIGIALFFIIRTYAGEIASGYHLPIWIMLTVIFLALFIASGKRRSELVNTGKKTRSSLEGYSRSLLNFYTTMFGVCTLISYALFTFFAEPVTFDGKFHQYIFNNFPAMLDRKLYMITLFPIIFGLMRYGQIIFEMQEGERPERVVSTDIPLMFAIVSWGILMITLIYAL